MEDVHAWAKAATRNTLRKAVDKAATSLEKAGMANLKVPELKVEGREQVALAAQLRAEAKRTGWLG